MCFIVTYVVKKREQRETTESTAKLRMMILKHISPWTVPSKSKQCYVLHCVLCG